MAIKKVNFLNLKVKSKKKAFDWQRLENKRLKLFAEQRTERFQNYIVSL